MRCRHFTLRLTAQHAHEDEAKLNDFLRTVAVQSVQTSTGAPGCWSVLVFYEGADPQPQQGSAAPTTAPKPEPLPDGGAPALTPDEQRIYERLREWRSQRASAEGKPPYVIANNAVLMHIARHHMSIKVADDLLAISKLGPARTARYGPDILQLLAGLATPDEAPLFDDER